MASDALAAHLVDRIAYRDEVIDELKQRTGRRKDSTEPFKQINLRTYAGLVAEDAPVIDSRGRVAVVYAEGDIVDGEGQIGEVGGRKFSRELRRLRLDADIKAIVLRVNSPGGSATASEEIQRELRLTLQIEARGRFHGLGGGFGRLLDLDLRGPHLCRAHHDHRLDRRLRTVHQRATARQQPGLHLGHREDRPARRHADHQPAQDGRGTCRLPAIGIGGGLGWFMMLNVWGIVWRMQKRIIRWTEESAAEGHGHASGSRQDGAVAVICARA